MSDVIELDAKRRKAKPLPTAGWERALLRAPGGAVKKLVANVILVMSNAPEWRGAVSWDEFAERIVIVRACPAGKPGPWGDLSDVDAASWLQRSEWRLEASPELVASAVRSVAAANSVHPLRARLSGLVWDGKARLDTWTTKYLGAADTPVHREMGLRWMLGAVSRAFVPGSQVDTALILEGHQGLGKSTAVRILSLGFFTDELADIGSKDAAMQLHGAWIVELPELDAMGRAETSRVKAFLTRRSDRYRAPYGRHVAEHHRQCTFVGTVNHNDYLKDETGGRRFLPVETTAIDLVALRADVEQLWAEAVTRHQGGERTYTAESALAASIAEHTSERYQGDVWHDVVKVYAELFGITTVAECLNHVGVEQSRRTQSDANRVAKILKSIGFVRRQVRNGLKRDWKYMSPAQWTKHGLLVTTGQPEKQGVVSTVTSVTSTTVKYIKEDIVNGGLTAGGVRGDTVVTGDEPGPFDDLIDTGKDEP